MAGYGQDQPRPARRPHVGNGMAGAKEPDLETARSRPLAGLLTAQFLGAFNDNAWKLLVALLAMRQLAATAGDPAAFEAAAQSRATLAFVIFTLPLMLVSLPAAALADRLSKRRIILAMKILEIGLMAAGTFMLWLHPAGWAGPLVILGLMGAQSALFSPAKYGIMPEILPHEALSRGNGLLEMWTFLAIIAGTGAGGLLLQAAGPAPWLAGLLLTALAAAGAGAARFVPAVPAAREAGRRGGSLGEAWRAMRAERLLWLAALGSALYWGTASLLGQDVLVYAKTFLDASDAGASALLAAFGLGVGAGSVLAGRLSGSRVEYGLIPLGSALFGCFILLLAVLAPGYGTTVALLALAGVASGLLVVPLNALLQWRAPAACRGGVVALANVLVFGGVLAGSLGVQALAWAGLSARQILLGGALVTLAGTAWALWLLPAALLRLLLVLLTHTVYRLRVLGPERVPRRGGALLAPNHVSFVDGLFLMAALDRPVRFIVDAGYFHLPVLRPFMQALQAIPISAAGSPRDILRSFRQARQALQEGHLVCIFPEGEITRTGMLLPFRRGLERIVAGLDVPVLPVHLDRVWGSIFSRAGGRFLTKLPRQLPYPVTVAFGNPLASGTPQHEVRASVQELGADAWRLRLAGSRNLTHRFIRMSRRHPRSLLFAELDRPPTTRLGGLTAAIALARALRPLWGTAGTVAILLPPGRGAAMAALAAALGARTAVHLNYTAGAAGLASAIRQAAVGQVLTSPVFLEKAALTLPDGVDAIDIENVAGRIGTTARLTALALALLAPARILQRACASRGARGETGADGIVTVIFSSGSTGEPKGIRLSHFNVLANIEAVDQVLRVEPSDRLLGVLPFFHSFGHLVLWFAATQRVAAVLHASPVDAAAVGALVQRHRVSLLIATPTFLQLYMRRCTPSQFGSLRLVLTGAEKLPPRLADSFEAQFGIRPLEGYGATECAPVVAASVPDFRAPGFYQPGSRKGSVGQPLPGVAVRIVDPESGERLPAGSPGMLLVRGPNIMCGYLGRDDLTQDAIRDGWYVTGDIAVLDEDGFLFITDRLARFSKIGGEMVPHGRVEDALHAAAGVDAGVFAVTGIPDERKGERLVVLHTLPEADIPSVIERLASAGLPNLFMPRKEAFVKVDALPLLGSGKLDLGAVRRIAQERRGMEERRS